MSEHISAIDYSLDNPKYQLIDVYYRIPVFRLHIENPGEGKNNRFWWGSRTKNEDFIVLGSDSTKQDLTHALCTMLRFSLMDYLLVSVDGHPAGHFDLKDEKAVDEFLNTGRI